MLTMVRSVMKKFSKFLANFLTAFYKFSQNFAFNVVIKIIHTSFIESASFKKKNQMSHLIFRNMKPGVKKPVETGGLQPIDNNSEKNNSKKIQTSSNSLKTTGNITPVYLM